MGAQWLLVSGASRSGTTFLNRLLNSHPQIALFTETGIDHLVQGAKEFYKTGRAISDFQDSNAEFETVVALVQMLTQLRFRKNNISFIGDKMPNVNLAIERQYTEAAGIIKKIFIIRRPASVVRSSMQRVEYTKLGVDTWHILSIYDAIVEWALFWEYAAYSHLQQDTLVISYESFQEN